MFKFIRRVFVLKGSSFSQDTKSYHYPSGVKQVMTYQPMKEKFSVKEILQPMKSWCSPWFIPKTKVKSGMSCLVSLLVALPIPSRHASSISWIGYKHQQTTSIWHRASEWCLTAVQAYNFGPRLYRLFIAQMARKISGISQALLPKGRSNPW